VQLKVTGFTDSIGDAVYNQGLPNAALRRSAPYLIGKGIPAGSILTSGRGENGLVSTDKLGDKNAEARTAGWRSNFVGPTTAPDHRYYVADLTLDCWR